MLADVGRNEYLEMVRIILGRALQKGPAPKVDLDEYMEEIRKEVCSRCVERPAGGPPCVPLGKPCGVELHLEELVKAVHEVRSDLIDAYLNNNRKKVCEHCAFLRHADFCPCPMDRLAVLVVEAIEAVDDRHRLEAQTAV
jgi:hypothetical protein